MEFCEAIDALKKGSKVTRKMWQGSTFFVLEGKDVVAYSPKLTIFPYMEGIMISEGWIVDGVEEELAFCHIIPYLLKGLKASLKEWPTDNFIQCDLASKSIILHSMDRFEFVPDFASFTATDWIAIP